MKGLASLCFLVIIGIFTSGCSDLMFQRSFVDEMDRESDGFWVAGRDFPVVAGDSGEVYRNKDEIEKRTPASLREKKRRRYRLSLKNELADLERGLEGQKLKRYRKARPYLKTTSEKIYYLKLSEYEKNQYLQTRVTSISNKKNIKTMPSTLNILSKSPVKNKKIYLGMNKGRVRHLWGRPLQVEIAGNPRYQNERWIFEAGRSQNVVYFENGKVKGWDLQ